MRNSLLKWTLGVSLLGVLTGCGKPVSKSELPGTYMADFGLATDTLTIKPDGQFTQTIKVKADGKVVTKNGTWHFKQDDHGIVFNENFMFVIDGFSNILPDFDQPNTNAVTFSPVRRRFGKLEFGGDDFPWGRTGVEAPYKKQKQPATPAK